MHLTVSFPFNSNPNQGIWLTTCMCRWRQDFRHGGKLKRSPENPIVPFIPRDGKPARTSGHPAFRVMDAAVAKASGGKLKIAPGWKCSQSEDLSRNSTTGGLMTPWMRSVISRRHHKGPLTHARRRLHPLR